MGSWARKSVHEPFKNGELKAIRIGTLGFPIRLRKVPRGTLIPFGGIRNRNRERNQPVALVD